MLNLVIVYGSVHVGASIAHHVSQLKSFEIVGQSHEAEDAVQMISTKRPHIVIIDAQLRDGSGLGVLQRAKQFGLPPVVFMTAASLHSQYRRECMRQGADYYFQLPDEIEGLVNTLSQLSSLFSTVDEEANSMAKKAKENQ
jgi:DNA-binding NarL/FixJ family response regulator